VETFQEIKMHKVSYIYPAYPTTDGREADHADGPGGTGTSEADQAADR
jgi:hypothetical protein